MGQNSKPRQWLFDRSNGKSKSSPTTTAPRPFCPLCWPPPCVKILPDLFEQNACCESYGKIGYFPEHDSKSRTWLMRLGMFSHSIGIILSILGCMAISSNKDLLKAFPFSSGSVRGTIGDVNVQTIHFEVGLRHIYVSDIFSPEGRTYETGELCTGDGNPGIPLTSMEDCNSCKDVSSGLVTTLILGVITYLPTIGSNFNRLYYHYDVNCQKVFGTIVALFSMVMTLYTWRGYAGDCFESFYDGEVQIPVLVPMINGTPTLTATDRPLNNTILEAFTSSSSSNVNISQYLNQTIDGLDAEWRVARVDFDWEAGTGLICIVIATFLKLVDIIGHFLLRTPSITRDRQMQLDYEKVNQGGDDDEDEEDVGGGDEEE